MTTSRLQEPPVTRDHASGTISHLLRTARTECQSAVSFVALSSGDQHFSAAPPGADVESGIPPSAVEDLVRRLRADPGIAQGRALLRTVQLDRPQPGGRPRRLAVAAVPLRADDLPTGDAASRPGFLGVADPEVKAFGFAELEHLSPVARRLASYLAARQEVQDVRGLGRQAVDGVLPPNALLDRTRRLLGAGARAGSLVVVALDVSGATGPADHVASAAVRAIRADLRFDDPVARLGETGFVAVVPLAPGGPGAETVADRLTASVRAAVDGTGALVRSAHVRTELAACADAIELVREVTGKLLRTAPGAPHAR